MQVHLTRLARLALALPLLAAPVAAQTWCECQQGLGPCGNDPPTALPSGCVNSTGLKGFLGPNGSFSVSADDLVMSSFNLPPGNTALLFMGGGAVQIPFGDGVLCVAAGASGVYRYPVKTVEPDGSLLHGPGLVAYSQSAFPPSGWLQSGDTWMFQLWYRDPGGPCGSGFNLTNGVGLTFEP